MSPRTRFPLTATSVILLPISLPRLSEMTSRVWYLAESAKLGALVLPTSLASLPSCDSRRLISVGPGGVNNVYAQETHNDQNQRRERDRDLPVNAA